MNGDNYFLDTNAMIELLKGNTTVENLLLSAMCIGTSIICGIKFLSFSNLTTNDRQLLSILLQRIHVIPIPTGLGELEQIAILRRQTKLKLPDAIIAATAVVFNATLIANDRHFNSISNLSITSL